MSVDVEQAATWRRAVEAAVEHLADDYEIDPAEVLAQEAFIARLDGTVGLDPDTDAERFAEIVETALAAHTATPARESTDAEERTTEATDHIEGHVTESLGTDASGGRVFRVRIIREGTSRNRKRYTESVLRKAAPLYNGAKCYDHHRTAQEMQTSTLQGLVGGYRNVGYESDGLYGDLHLFPSAVHTAEALDAAIDAQAAGLPPLVGISHDVHASFKAGTPTHGGHVQEAVAITQVNSADVVADPSAGGQATRVLAGGIESEEAAVPLTAEELAAIGTAAGTAAAAALLNQQPVTESTETERVTESGESKDLMTVKGFIKAKLTDAGMAPLFDAIHARLPERVTEAHVDAEIAAYKTMLGDVERVGLTPTVTAQVTRESLDKKKEGLDRFFTGDFSGYHSFREAYFDFTGRRPRAIDADLNRQILRESFGGGFDSRTTESLDSTSWAQALGDSVTRRLVAEYKKDNLNTWRKIVRVVPVSDFRTQRLIRVGGYPALPTVNEGAPYQPLTSPGDEEATYALTKKGGTEDFTLEMVANDDVRSISRIPGKLGRTAARTIYEFVWAFLSGNATCTFDSVALFHSSHANTDTSAGLQQSTLSTGRRKMIEQTAYGDSTEVLGLLPKFLVVPPELEETALVLTGSRAVPASNTVGASDQPNIHQGLEPILVPSFSDANDWFLVADPMDIPTIEIGFYQGREEPELFTQNDNSVGSVFNADTFTLKIRHIYNGTIEDYRGFYRGVG